MIATATAATTEIRPTVLKILAELSTTTANDIRDEQLLREDLGLDSVSSMELVSMLAEVFDIDVSLEDAMAVKDVKGVMSLASRVLAK